MRAGACIQRTIVIQGGDAVDRDHAAKGTGFAQLDGESRQFLADTAELAEAEAGDELFREGALPELLYVLLDGRVMLTGTAADASST